MAERFSQKNLRVRPSSDEEKIVTNAKKHFEKTLVEISGELVGSVADHPLRPATDRSLGEPLPHQLANLTQAHLVARASKRGPLSP